MKNIRKLTLGLCSTLLLACSDPTGIVKTDIENLAHRASGASSGNHDAGGGAWDDKNRNYTTITWRELSFNLMGCDYGVPYTITAVGKFFLRINNTNDLYIYDEQVRGEAERNGLKYNINFSGRHMSQAIINKGGADGTKYQTNNISMQMQISGNGVHEYYNITWRVLNINEMIAEIDKIGSNNCAVEWWKLA
jgi:hypothetical protein